MPPSQLINKVTIVTTPHYDHRLLKIFIKYYYDCNFPSQLLILDSTGQDIPNEELYSIITSNKHIIQYITFPHNTRFEEKLAKGLKYLHTPYAAILSEDDFITPSGLIASVNHLDKNPDYSLAHGTYAIYYLATNLNNEGKFSAASLPQGIPINSDSPLERIYHLITHFTLSPYSAVYRSDILKKIWEETVFYSDDPRFGELLPAVLSVIEGKLAIIDVFYCARRGGVASYGQTCETLASYVRNGSYDRKYKLFKECIIKNLLAKSKETITAIEADKLIDKAMYKYFYNYSGIPLSLYRRKSIAKILDFLRPFYRKIHSLFNTPKYQPTDISTHTPDIHKELSRIKNTILSCPS